MKNFAAETNVHYQSVYFKGGCCGLSYKKQRSNLILYLMRSVLSILLIYRYRNSAMIVKKRFFYVVQIYRKNISLNYLSEIK